MLHEYKAMRVAVDPSGVAEVTFTEAKRGNPIDGPFCADLNALWIQLGTNAAVRAVQFRAEGKAFSYGGDLSSFGTSLGDLPGVVLSLTGTLHQAIARLQRMNAPLVAAVHGICAGGMAGFIAGCDFIVAGDEARFVAAYGAIGFSCDASSSITLTRRMGPQRARRYLLLNETLDAKAAHDAGLVDEVVPTAVLPDRARALAEQLATGPTRAFGETRRLLLSAQDQPLETQLELESQALARITLTEDAREGVTAFTAKRKPRFVGR